MKEKYLEEYLKVTNDKIPELIDMLFGINKLSNNYIFEFGDLSEYEYPFKYKEMDLKTSLDLIKEFLIELDKDYYWKFEKLINSGNIDIFDSSEVDSYDNISLLCAWKKMVEM